MTHSSTSRSHRSASHSPGRLLAWGSVGLVLVLLLSRADHRSVRLGPLMPRTAAVTRGPPSRSPRSWRRYRRASSTRWASTRRMSRSRRPRRRPVSPSSPTRAVLAPRSQGSSISAARLLYCAAERWALISALSRFGAFRNLGITTSSPTDAYPSTQTLSFYRASLESDLVALRAVEHYSNDPDPKTGWTILENPTPSQSALLNRYARTSGGGSASRSSRSGTSS